MNRAAVVLALCGWLLAGCATPPMPTRPAATSPSPTSPSPRAIVATIRAAAVRDDTEVAVQPLRDPRVEDLRQQALRLEAMQRDADAATQLDKALAIVPADPALLQERAEVAVLLGDNALAEQLARRAYASGAKVGPLCRRHWATVREMRRAMGDATGAATAQAQVDACKVAGPIRY